MPWALRRRILYILGIVAFLGIVVGIPLILHFHVPASCHDGAQDQGESSPDHGGPCLFLDESSLEPHAVLWARAFRVRDGSYDAVAYVQNPNAGAGVLSAPYRFGLYDSQNVLIAEVTGTTFVMPGSVTPVFLGNINTGNRIVAHTYFEFTAPLTWERAINTASPVTVNNKQVSNTDTAPRVAATITNASVADLMNLTFVAVVFDPAGNAFGASQTAVPRLNAGESQQIVFTWPSPFPTQVGSVDVIPLSLPVPDPAAER